MPKERLSGNQDSRRAWVMECDPSLGSSSRRRMGTPRDEIRGGRSFSLKRFCRRTVGSTMLLLLFTVPVLSDENYDKLPEGATTPARYVNSQLPGWLRVGGVFRTQWEGRTGDQYQAGNDFGYAVTRLRLNLEATPTPWFRLFVQAEDSRVAGMESARVSPAFKDVMDLKQVYLEFTTAGENNTFDLRIGRQELFFGGQRLIGDAFWGNTGAAFDTLKLAFNGDHFGLEVFAAAPVGVSMTETNRRRPGEYLYGAYGSVPALVPHTKIEPYLLLKTVEGLVAANGSPSDVDVYTTGVRWATNLPSGFEFSAEGARQTGHRLNDQIGAWAAYGNAGYTFDQVGYQPHISAEYGYASGDDRQAGKNGTFDDLYPGRHGYLGMADLFGWRNIQHLRSSIDFQVLPSVKVIFDHNFLWLANKNDGLYGGNSQLAVAAPAGGAISGDVGQEVDIVVRYSPVAAITVEAGFGHLFPGKFLKEASSGAGGSFPYLSMTYRF